MARTGSWRLRSAEAVPGDLNRQIRALLAAVTGDLSVWRSLSARHRCDVFCGLFMGGANEGEDIEPDVLSALGERGLTLGLDIYGSGAGD